MAFIIVTVDARSFDRSEFYGPYKTSKQAQLAADEKVASGEIFIDEEEDENYYVIEELKK